MAKHAQAVKDEARATLMAMLKPGDTVYTVLDSVSWSGMSRIIRVLVAYTRDDGSVDHWHPNHSVGVLLGLPYGTYRRQVTNGLKISGCGMYMGFDLVYSLGRALWPDGFACPGETCPSNDHSNGDRNRKPHHHTDGGYALRHRWL